jgi:hypothetical protein
LKLFPLLAIAVLVVTVVGFWVTSVVTLSVYANADTYAWQSVPDANNGYSDNFEITSANVNPKNMRGWVAFDLQELPSNAWMLNAQLQLRVWSKSENDPSKGFGDSTGRIYGVYRITQSWRENNLTWTNQPNYTDEHHAIAAVPPGHTDWNEPPIYMNWDVTSIVHDWQSGIPNYGFLVRDTQENSPILYSTQFFTHNQVPNESYYPKLIVMYAPFESMLAFLLILAVEGGVIIVVWRLKSRGADTRARK